MKDENFGDSLIKSTFRIEWTSKNFFEVLKLDQLDKTMLLCDKRLRQTKLQFYVTDNFPKSESRLRWPFENPHAIRM